MKRDLSVLFEGADDSTLSPTYKTEYQIALIALSIDSQPVNGRPHRPLQKCRSCTRRQPAARDSASPFGRHGNDFIHCCNAVRLNHSNRSTDKPVPTNLPTTTLVKWVGADPPDFIRKVDFDNVLKAIAGMASAEPSPLNCNAAVTQAIHSPCQLSTSLKGSHVVINRADIKRPSVNRIQRNEWTIGLADDFRPCAIWVQRHPLIGVARIN